MPCLQASGLDRVVQPSKVLLQHLRSASNYLFAGEFWELGTPVKTKLLSTKIKLLLVKFELGPLEICLKFSDLYDLP